MNTEKTESALTFGELLKRYRVAAGLTQEALAERARVSPRTISDLERGVTSWPYRDTVALLAAALELTADERATLQVARRRPPGRVASRSPNDPAPAAPALASVNVTEPAAGPVDPPSHLRTFLVADLPSYTRFMHERGDAAAAQLAAQFAELVREGVALQGGRVIELRGDEAVAAFGSARQALRAALALQERCAQATAADPPWPLSMGMGLDAGEAIPVEGGYRGAALNLAEQLCSMAAAGEVLASAGVAHLARKTEGLVYLDRGEVMLESLGDVVRVIQVLPADAVADADARIIDVDRLRDPERRQAQISALYRAAQAAMAVGNWAVALERLTDLLTLEPGHQEAAALADRARRQQEVPDLYSKGREQYDAGRWRAALDYFRQVQEIAGNYKGVFALMATAQHEVEREEALRGLETAPAALRVTDRRDSPLGTHYKQVIKALVDGRVVPFLGAEISLCGRPAEVPWRHGQYLPTHTELAAYLVESFDYQWHDVLDLARVSQHVAIMTGTRPLYSALHDLYDSDYPSTPVHRFLATLPGALRATGHAPRYQLIVTTTYDDLLERAFQAAGEPFDLVSYAVEGPSRGTFVHYPPGAEARMIDRPNEYRGLSLDQRTVILKLHGAVDRSNPERDSYVITEDNYINYLARLDVSSLLPVTLLAKLRTSHVLFLGYSLREWSQRVIVHRLWGEQKLSDNYKCWALHVDVQPIDREFWSKRDVAILPVRPDEYIAVLSERVQALARVGTGA